MTPQTATPDYLRRWRRRLHLSQREAAHLMNRHPSVWRAWEQSKKRIPLTITIPRLEKLAERFLAAAQVQTACRYCRRIIGAWLAAGRYRCPYCERDQRTRKKQRLRQAMPVPGYLTKKPNPEIALLTELEKDGWI